MIDPLDKEINIDEIMERIRDEVKRRKKLPVQETFQETEQLPSQSSAIKHMTVEKSYDNFLWRYGKRHKKIIKAIPILKSIAKKQHSRLAAQFIHSQPLAQQPLVNIDVLPNYINYHGFLVQVREEEGLKGRIKSFLFKFIRFFAWWQEQINRALYQELMSQKAKIDARDRWLQELLRQQVNSLKKDLDERDKMIEDLNNRVILLNHTKDELSRELNNQRIGTSEVVRRMEGLLDQQRDYLGTIKSEFTGSHKSLREEIESTKKELAGLLEINSNVHQIMEEMRNQKEEDRFLDGTYVAFEDRFRGSRDKIKERLKVYLPYVKEVSLKTNNSPTLDLGCGRGEWLELLRENGFVAKGVDFNRVMVRQCQEIGLDVLECDVIEYLRNQQASSLGAVTGFHILEHLSLKAIISLFDEAFRVLRSEGMVIFETPNPENLIVAACNFYSDPSHRHPLPPGLLNFLIESGGFRKIKIVRLHPYPFLRKEQKTSLAVKALISLFNTEQDYSVIAYK